MLPVLLYLSIVTAFFICAALDDWKSRIIRNRWHIIIIATSLLYGLLFFDWWIPALVVLWSFLYLVAGNVIEWLKGWMHGDTKLLMAVGSTVPFLGAKVSLLYLAAGWLIGMGIYKILPKRLRAAIDNEDTQNYPMGLSFAIGFSLFLLVGLVLVCIDILS